MGCVQAQYAPSTYVGLWSRVDGVDRDAVTLALEQRSLVQGTLMRNTIHVVSRRDYWPLVLAIRSTGVAPVWASLYDASGRRVMTRELGVLPAGVQSVPLELGLQKAGIYFVRVSQGGNASTRKIVLL